MAIPAYLRRSYGGGAEPLLLAGDIGASDLTFTLANSDIGTVASWLEEDGSALGTAGPFVVCFDRFTPTVEKVLCSSIDLGTGVVAVYDAGGNSGRGYDRTLAQAHVASLANPLVQHVASAVDLDEANQLVKLLLGNLGTTGQVPTSTGSTIGWQSAPSPSCGGAPPVTGTSATSAAGSNGTGSRSDHGHGFAGVGSHHAATPVYGSTPSSTDPLKVITGLVTVNTDTSGDATITWSTDLGDTFANAILCLDVRNRAGALAYAIVNVGFVTDLVSFPVEVFSGSTGSAPTYFHGTTVLDVFAIGW
jgi:hypothetical protein